MTIESFSMPYDPWSRSVALSSSSRRLSVASDSGFVGARDLHTQQNHRRREVHDDVEIELAARPHDPQARLDLGVARAVCPEAVEEAFDLVFRYHRESCCR
jgi:hypothetical protein